MTTQEFSEQFDVLNDSIVSNLAAGINEFEKSVFLTKAEKQIVLEHFDAALDRAREGFDGSIKRQYDFSSLIQTVLLPLIYDGVSPIVTLSKYGKLYAFPNDYYLSVSEIIEDFNNHVYQVLPISYTQYSDLTAKVYPFPPKRQVVRTFIGLGRSNQLGALNNSEFSVYENSIADVSFFNSGYSFIVDDLKLRIRAYEVPPVSDEEYEELIQENDGVIHITAERQPEDKKIKVTVRYGMEDPTLQADNLEYDLDTLRSSTSPTNSTLFNVSTWSLRGKPSVLGAIMAYVRACRSIANSDKSGYIPTLEFMRIVFNYTIGQTQKEYSVLVWNGDWRDIVDTISTEPEPVLRGVNPTSTLNSVLDLEESLRGGETATTTPDPNAVTDEPGNTENNEEESVTTSTTTTTTTTTTSTTTLPPVSTTTTEETESTLEYINTTNEDLSQETPNSNAPTTKEPTIEVFKILDILKSNIFEKLHFSPYITTADLHDKDFLLNSSKDHVVAEVLGRFPKSDIKNYILRYVRIPKPIILVDLTNGYSIDGITTRTECELPKELHLEILERAVMLAQIAYGGTTESLIAENSNKNNRTE